MSEDEQRDFVRNILITKYHSNWMLDQWDKSRFSLADLAFRLRDEACKVSCEKYYKALEAVYNHRIKDKQCCSFHAFQMYQIRPIDMITAALKAKEKEDA